MTTSSGSGESAAASSSTNVPPSRADRKTFIASSPHRAGTMPRELARTQAHADGDPVLRFATVEWAFLAGTILCWAALVISLGQDTSWDFRNYHWYIPYAFLNHRMGFDIAVAHQATYYNPILDIPYYLLTTHVKPWIAAGVMGAVQGSNIVPLYIMARQTLRGPERMLSAAFISLMGITGALALGLLGTTYYDNVMSVLVLSSLAILVVNRETLARGSLWRTAWLTGVAGFLTGSAVGLKLPEAPFALGFAAAALAGGGDWKHLSTRVIAGAIGGVPACSPLRAIGMHVYALTGDPLFPYFNQYFHSPLALAAPYRDERFLQHGFWNMLLFPLRFTWNWAVADDLPFPRHARGAGLCHRHHRDSVPHLLAPARARSADRRRRLRRSCSCSRACRCSPG